MTFNKPLRDEKKERSLICVVREFDAKDEMLRAVRDLKKSMVMPMENIYTRGLEEEARSAQEHYDRTLAQINSAQQRYLERLEQAKKEGAVDHEDYSKARRDVSSPFSPFERMKREAQEAYRKVVKFS